MSLTDTFTSTGSKFFAHQDVMEKLRDGRGQPITTHIMLTDVCQHTCAFCSVQARAGDSLMFDDVRAYLDILLRYGLKSVILSGGGNPLLYRCKKTSAGISDVIDHCHGKGLEVGLITNGMHLRKYGGEWSYSLKTFNVRESWQTLRPESLDRLAWVRVSMSGLDHDEREVYVPDVDPSKTTLGFSYVAHDLYEESADPHHGKVSRPLDLISGDRGRGPDQSFEERQEWLTGQIADIVRAYRPRYVRLLPNCLEPALIPLRVRQLEGMARDVNARSGLDAAFVQNKPPAAPKACYLGYVHPVLAPSGYVMPCDSHCLNESADHKLGGEPWRICHWSEVAKLYEQPVRSLIADPAVTCPGCVFSQQNEVLGKVVDDTIQLGMPTRVTEHINFV